jgi:hydroxymethylbilane synthase
VIRAGTRGSVLALAQARSVVTALPGVAAEIVPMRTEGDRLADARLALVGGKGLFVREIEEALLRGEIDLAVHSLKDVPAEPPAGLVLAAFPAREDPRDVLVAARTATLDTLGHGARVGTSSPRRRALLLSVRPDLAVEPIRGNVDTRLRKLAAGDWDAVVLAAAGLHRLGLAPPHGAPLDPEVFVPAVGQGIIAVEARADDRATLALLAHVDDAATHACALAERAYLARLGASCNTPMAAHARLDGGVVRLSAVVASEDGRQVLRASATASPADAVRLGREVADMLLARGAAAVAALEPRRGTAVHEPSLSGHVAAPGSRR